MSEMTLEQKCALYERVLKYITSASEIRFKRLSKDGDYGFVELVDVDPNDIKIAGFDDGLYLEYSSEAYMEDYGGIIEPKEETRIITEIWFGEDPWETIKKLREKTEPMIDFIPNIWLDLDSKTYSFEIDENSSTNYVPGKININQSLSETAKTEVEA